MQVLVCFPASAGKGTSTGDQNLVSVLKSGIVFFLAGLGW